jgi:hypothetical protein
MADRDIHPDMRTKKQVTVRMTDQFAKDLNVLLACYGDKGVSYVLQRTIALHAGYIRRRWATEQAVLQEKEN